MIIAWNAPRGELIYQLIMLNIDAPLVLSVADVCPDLLLWSQLKFWRFSRALWSKNPVILGCCRAVRFTEKFSEAWELLCPFCWGCRSVLFQYTNSRRIIHILRLSFCIGIRMRFNRMSKFIVSLILEYFSLFPWLSLYGSMFQRILWIIVAWLVWLPVLIEIRPRVAIIHLPSVNIWATISFPPMGLKTPVFFRRSFVRRSMMLRLFELLSQNSSSTSWKTRLKNNIVLEV